MKIFIFTIVLFLTLGCEFFNFPKATLVRLQNETEHDLIIITYVDNIYGANSPVYLKYIKMDSIFIKKNNAVERIVHPGDWESSYFRSDTDSLIIYFGSRKKLIQSCNGLLLTSILDNECVIPNNLLSESNATKEEIKSGKYERRITYKITQSDYDRAVNL